MEEKPSCRLILKTELMNLLLYWFWVRQEIKKMKRQTLKKELKVWGLNNQDNEIAFISQCSREEQAESRTSEIKCDTCSVFDVGAMKSCSFLGHLSVFPWR